MSSRGSVVSDDSTFQKSSPRARRSAPKAGDILASERSARADVFTVSIVPNDTEVTVGRHSAAIELVQELARTRQVDGWFTCDSIHYARVASYRS